MPYLLVSTQIRLECGPTFVGDGKSDKSLMAKLEAIPSKQLGNEFSVSIATFIAQLDQNVFIISFSKLVKVLQEYMTNLTPREVLNLLEKEGWKVIGMAGIGQTCAWTLHKDE